MRFDCHTYEELDALFRSMGNLYPAWDNDSPIAKIERDAIQIVRGSIAIELRRREMTMDIKAIAKS